MKKRKVSHIFLIAAGVAIIGIVTAVYFGLKNISLTDCEEKESFYVQDYEIVKYSCIGPVGPFYYPLDLYKNDKLVDKNGFQLDSCHIRFIPRSDLYLKFNICDQTITELQPIKKVVDLNVIDSASIYSKKLARTKNLTDNQIKSFVLDWNKSEVSDYRNKHLDSIFYPDYQYKIKLFSRHTVREFTAFSFLISDESKWTYYMTDPDNTAYFKLIWNATELND